MQDSQVINKNDEFNLPLAWKIIILLEIKQTKEWGRDIIKMTMFYMKTDDK